MSETKSINSQAKDNDKHGVYELGYHILPTVAENEVEEKINEIRNVIKDLEGEFIMEGEPEMIELAYTMIVPRGGHNDKYDKAYFGWIKFKMPKISMPALRKELKLNQNLLRFILFKTAPEDTRANLKIVNELKEVKTQGTIENKTTTEEAAEVSEESLDKAIDDIAKDS